MAGGTGSLHGQAAQQSPPPCFARHSDGLECCNPALPAALHTDRKIAIEVDGPFHFAVNTNSPLGQTMIRRRLLRACGWTVISVPCHTWWVDGHGGWWWRELLVRLPQISPSVCRPPMRGSPACALLGDSSLTWPPHTQVPAAL